MSKFKVTQAELNNIEAFIDDIEGEVSRKITHKPKFDDEANTPIQKKRTKVKRWTRPEVDIDQCQ